MRASSTFKPFVLLLATTSGPLAVAQGGPPMITDDPGTPGDTRDTRDTRSGIGNSLLGVKWRFYDAGESGWQVSTYPQLQFNYPESSAPRRGFADAGSSWLLPLEFERGFAAFGINFEFGRWHRPAAQPDS